jgi:uncharacterized protein YutD
LKEPLGFGEWERRVCWSKKLSRVRNLFRESNRESNREPKIATLLEMLLEWNSATY